MKEKVAKIQGVTDILNKQSGLLGLSDTPALRAFGMTLLLGIGLVWLLSPLFRPAPPSTTGTP